MKPYIIIIFFLFTSYLSQAQSGKKPAAKEKTPTQKEMEDMMKEAEKMMGEINAEDKKMMDSLGIKMPDMNKMKKDAAGVSDKQLAEAWEVENLIVPKKDAARIAAIAKAPLTAGSVGVYVKDVHTKTLLLLWPASKTLGEKLYAQLKATGKSSDAIGNTAAGLWIMGRLQPALYIMGRICTEDAANTDNLSNYASMLSMIGVQQSAIPVLNYLNSKFPRNSTLLNNLGQAWFGLGDMQKAEKYLDSAIRIYAYHPQANFTKSFIEEEKGNTSAAVSLVKKAILHTYSQEKEERLRKLGYKLTSKDVTLPKNTKNDPLNLGSATPPPFPMSVDECIAMEPVWTTYRSQLKAQGAALNKQAMEAQKIAADIHEKRMQADMNMIKASMQAMKPQGELTPVPIHAKAAYLKQNEVTETFKRKMEVFQGKVSEGFKTVEQATIEYEATMEKLREADGEQTGEGKPNKDYCPKYKDASDKFLRSSNGTMEPLFKEYMQIQKQYLNELTHWQMYSEWPEKFEVHKLAAKMSWLGVLLADPPITFKSITEFKCAPPAQSKGSGKLAQFDDIACKYHSEVSLFIGRMKADCSRFTTEVDFGVVKLGLKQDMDKETFADQFMGCNIEIGMKAGKDVKMGPLSVEVSAGARVGIEIDRTGVKDVYVTGAVKAGAGTHMISDAAEALETSSSALGQGIGDLSIDGGVEGKISLISGRGSIYGTGIFRK